MTILQAVIIGVVEGITEFLPISSTGHMIIVSQWLGLTQDEHLKRFEVMIQIGAIAAVVFYYRTRFFAMRRIYPLILLGSLPILIVGFLFASQIKSLFSVLVVAIMFIVGGVIFLITEHFYRLREKHGGMRVGSLDQLSIRSVLIIGLCQVLSLVPGTSRAGATIVGGLWLGFTRKMAAEFSFLLAVPVMIAVTLYDGIVHFDTLVSGAFSPLMVGLITAFVSAYCALVLFVKFLDQYSFVVFGLYRIVFGVILLIILYVY